MRRVPSKRDDGISSYVGIPDRISRERREKKKKKKKEKKREKKRGKNGEEHDTHVEHRHLHTTITTLVLSCSHDTDERVSFDRGGREGGTESVLKARINLRGSPPPSDSLRIPITLRYRIRQIDTEEKRFD